MLLKPVCAGRSVAFAGGQERYHSPQGWPCQGYTDHELAGRECIRRTEQYSMTLAAGAKPGGNVPADPTGQLTGDAVSYRSSYRMAVREDRHDFFLQGIPSA
jgi:hypothetical protein